MENNFDTEDESLRPQKRRKKLNEFYKKDKYALSKLFEYENYITNIELLSKGEGL